MDYYGWHITLSYNADVTIVVAPRGIGKTYGIRVQSVKDWIKREFRFVEICRYKNELAAVMDGYFDKIAEEFPGYIFRTHSAKGFIARKPEDENEKPKWKTICYFIALSDAQNAKKRTYKNVKRLIFDEAILDRSDRYHRYIPNEYSRLANVVDTTTRERPDSLFRPHLYLLGNACDLTNPYFNFYGIDKIPKYGYTWYRHKTVLLHYAAPSEYGKQKLDGTLSGRMTRGTIEGDIAAFNKFQTLDDSLIESKPKSAKYVCAFVSDGDRFGVWSDDRDGYFYINNKIIEDDSHIVYYITREDATINRLQAHRATPAIIALRDAHRISCIKYDTLARYNSFLDMLAKFGL